jgi:hypothetical protein
MLNIKNYLDMREEIWLDSWTKACTDTAFEAAELPLDDLFLYFDKDALEFVKAPFRSIKQLLKSGLVKVLHGKDIIGDRTECDDIAAFAKDSLPEGGFCIWLEDPYQHLIEEYNEHLSLHTYIVSADGVKVFSKDLDILKEVGAACDEVRFESEELYCDPSTWCLLVD